jgi:hypothetical protein
MDRTPASLLQRLRQPAEQAAWGRRFRSRLRTVTVNK